VPCARRDDSRDAVAALNSAFGHKGLGEYTAQCLWEPLERSDLGPGHLFGPPEAGQHGPAVHENGAAAAVALWGAPVLGRGNAALLTQHLEEVHSLFEGHGRLATVQLE
jgi:hypothetical protein